MKAVGTHPEFEMWVLSTTYKRITIAEIAELSLRVYADSASFTAIHAMTASHALRIVLPYLPSHLRQSAICVLWQGILSAIIAVDSKHHLLSEKSYDASCDVSWDEIKKVTLVRNEDYAHTIKLVYSAYEEAKVYRQNDELYRFVAYRRLMK
ncbi:MAG: hypothetical protein ACO2ZM_09225 [Francisellaceae bacterium]